MDDTTALAILRSCRRALGPHARLLLIEHVIAEPNQSCAGKMLDMQMMVRQGGRNRTEDGFRTLLSAADFRVARLIGTPDAPHVVPATP